MCFVHYQNLTGLSKIDSIYHVCDICHGRHDQISLALHNLHK
jgi:hypothetical protein